MKSLKVDNDGDLVIENGELVFIDEYEEMAQSIFINLSINKEEWFLNINTGLDYSLFEGKGVEKRLMIAELEESIMQVLEVEQVYIDDVEVRHDTRELNIHGYATDREGVELDLSTLEVMF